MAQIKETRVLRDNWKRLPFAKVQTISASVKKITAMSRKH